MKNQKTRNKFEDILKDSIICIVSAVWVMAILANFFKKYDIPNSVEVIFTMVVGYLLSGKVIHTFKK